MPFTIMKLPALPASLRRALSGQVRFLAADLYLFARNFSHLLWTHGLRSGLFCRKLSANSCKPRYPDRDRSVLVIVDVMPQFGRTCDYAHSARLNTSSNDRPNVFEIRNANSRDG